MNGRRACVWAWWAAWAVLITPALADWDQDCPPSCKCTHSSNRKLADCRSAGFSTVPTTLSTEVQELNLANNNIIYLEKDAFKKAGLVNLQKLYLKDNQIRSVHKDAF
ncbi:Biglycan-like [Homarus americanus]|uniref:Biglycan-like n=1 Tax=Homarus americanus TaxID=6706 RepID=A0A8J5TJR9_HOMAM|nr:Biglycan-like [Homarus americanus]